MVKANRSRLGPSAPFFFFGGARGRFRGGVAHSFTGSAEELRELLALDLYIGINGCSLKSADNLQVMAQVRPSALNGLDGRIKSLFIELW